MSVMPETASVPMPVPPGSLLNEPDGETSSFDHVRRAEIDAILSILASSAGAVEVEADPLYSRAPIAATIARRLVGDPLSRPGVFKFGTPGRMSSGLCAMARLQPNW